MKVKTDFAVYDECYLRVNKYCADDSVAIQIWNYEDGPIATLTTCLDDKNMKENEVYIDLNNCPWAVDFINEYNLGEYTGQMKQSGFCTYPKYKLDMNEIKKYEARENISEE